MKVKNIIAREIEIANDKNNSDYIKRENFFTLKMTANFIFRDFYSTIDREDELVIIKTPSQRNVTTQLRERNMIFIFDGNDLVGILKQDTSNDKKYFVRLAYYNAIKTYIERQYKYSEIKTFFDAEYKDKELSYYYVEQNKDVEAKRKVRLTRACDLLNPIYKFDGIYTNIATRMRYEKRALLLKDELIKRSEIHIEYIKNNLDITEVLQYGVKSGKPTCLSLDDEIKSFPSLSEHYAELRKISSYVAMINKKINYNFNSFFELYEIINRVKEYLAK